MKLAIKKDFAFAHRGCDVVQYVKGQEVETDNQELIDTALQEKWATAVSDKKVKAAVTEDARAPMSGPADAAAQPAAQPDFPPADPDAKGGENNPLTMADAEADLAGTPRPE